MSRPQNCFEPYPDPKISSLGRQKVKIEPKIRSKLNVRIEKHRKQAGTELCQAQLKLRVR